MLACVSGAQHKKQDNHVLDKIRANWGVQNGGEGIGRAGRLALGVDDRDGRSGGHFDVMLSGGVDDAVSYRKEKSKKSIFWRFLDIFLFETKP